MTRIETPRLLLRAPVPADAAAIAWLMTADVSHWLLNWPHPFSETMAQQRIAEADAAMHEGRSCCRVIAARGAGTVMGWLGITLTHETPRSGTLSYWLGTGFHGQGYIGEALPPFLQVAGEALRLERLAAGVQPDNTASVAALQRIGMTFVEEGMEFVPARQRMERTAVYALSFRPASAASPSR